MCFLPENPGDGSLSTCMIPHFYLFPVFRIVWLSMSAQTTTQWGVQEKPQHWIINGPLLLVCQAWHAVDGELSPGDPWCQLQSFGERERGSARLHAWFKRGLNETIRMQDQRANIERSSRCREWVYLVKHKEKKSFGCVLLAPCAGVMPQGSYSLI